MDPVHLYVPATVDPGILLSSSRPVIIEWVTDVNNSPAGTEVGGGHNQYDDCMSTMLLHPTGYTDFDFSVGPFSRCRPENFSSKLPSLLTPPSFRYS